MVSDKPNENEEKPAAAQDEQAEPTGPEMQKYADELADLQADVQVYTKHNTPIPADIQKKMQDLKDKIKDGGGGTTDKQTGQAKALQQKQNKAQAELRAANKEDESIKEQLRIAKHRVQELEYSAKAAEKKVADKRIAVKEVAAEVMLFHQDAGPEEEEDDDDEMDQTEADDEELERQKQQKEMEVYVQQMQVAFQQLQDQLKAANAEAPKDLLVPTVPKIQLMPPSTKGKLVGNKAKLKHAQVLAAKTAAAAKAAAEQAAKDSKA